MRRMCADVEIHFIRFNLFHPRRLCTCRREARSTALYLSNCESSEKPDGKMASRRDFAEDRRQADEGGNEQEGTEETEGR